MIESPTRKNNLLRLRQFDKCYIFVKNSVYLKSLIDLLMSPAPPAMSLVCNGAQSTSPSKDHDFWDSLLRSLACVPLVSPPFQNGRHPWRRQARHHEQEVYLEDNSKGQSYATVHPPDVPVPLPVPSRCDPGVRPVAP